MEEDSRLKGGIPATSVAERVWGMPKKRRPSEDKSRRPGGSGRESPDREQREEPVAEAEEHPEPEELGYSSDGMMKKRTVQVDVVI
jgi:hypothetical protein